MTTTLSTKGQIILPKEIRDRHGWKPGTRFHIETTRGGVLLKPAAPSAPRITAEQFIEEMQRNRRYTGKPKTIEEMDEAIAMAVRAGHARGRY